MSRRVRRFLLGILAGLALVSSLSIGSLASAYAASRHEELHYYGANLQDVARATGVSLDGTVDPNGP